VHPLCVIDAYGFILGVALRLIRLFWGLRPETQARVKFSRQHHDGRSSMFGDDDWFGLHFIEQCAELDFGVRG
jgi:hypothetical protein